jgi:putative SOS response-associated peptidase YedK
MAPVHNRMPVILHPGDFDRWLSREQTHQPPIDLLRPFPEDEMEAFEVSKDVGNVKNNSPELLKVQRILRPLRAREGQKRGRRSSD